MTGHALAALLILRLVFPRASGARRRALVGWWAAKLLRIVGVCTQVEGDPPALDEAGAMIAANHVSWLDIFVLQAARPTRFVAKSEVRDWPVAGWIAERSGTLFIRRSLRRDISRINELVQGALDAGDCVGIFPEGGTTEGDELLKFHSSLFEAAVANQAHVHPCAIRYEHADGSLCRAMAYVGELSFMQSLGLVIRQRRVVACIRYAPPVHAAGTTRRELAVTCHAAVASLLGLELPRTAPRRDADPAGAPP
jgi:1-acyl-sn-glycerol-3-phosphate acyltransferase